MAALVIGLLVQLAPPVLRSVGSGEGGILAVGPLCLALALSKGPGNPQKAGAGLLALLAGAWAAPAGLLLGLVGLLQRRAALAWGLLPLLPLLLVSASHLPGSARLAPLPARTVAAYVSTGGTVLPCPRRTRRGRPSPRAPSSRLPARRPKAPCPAGRRAPRSPAPPRRGAGSGTGLERIPGGAGLWAALALALASGRRRVAALGLALVCAWTLLFGLIPPNGAQPAAVASWLQELAPWLPALRPPWARADWLLLPLALVPLALTGARHLPVLLLPILVGAALENPRASLPVTNLAPGGVEAVAGALPEGSIAFFPSPTSPWEQGKRSPAELAVLGQALGHPLPVSPDPGPEAALLLQLSQQLDLAVDLRAGPLAGSLRGGDPLQLAREGGVVGLLIDGRELDPETRRALDGWLAARIGTPLAQDAELSLYGLAELTEVAPLLSPGAPPPPPPGAPPGPR